MEPGSIFAFTVLRVMIFRVRVTLKGSRPLRSIVSVTAVPGSPLMRRTTSDSDCPFTDLPSTSRIWSPGRMSAAKAGVSSMGVSTRR